MPGKQLKRGRCQVAQILERTGIHRNVVPALLEEMKDVRGIGQFRRLQHIISILRVHVARQCGATDFVEEVREIRVAESGGTVQMERMEHLVSRKARPGARVAVMDESKQKRGLIIAETGSKWADVRGAYFGVRSFGIPIDTDSGGTANDFEDS